MLRRRERETIQQERITEAVVERREPCIARRWWGRMEGSVFGWLYLCEKEEREIAVRDGLLPYGDRAMKPLVSSFPCTRKALSPCSARGLKQVEVKTAGHLSPAL